MILRTPTDAASWAFYWALRAVFARGLSFGPRPAAPLAIPAQGDGTATRPLIIYNNSHDATITDMYFANPVASGQRLQ